MSVRVDFICFLCALGLAVVCACLISVWRGFAIFTGMFACVASVIYVWWRYKKYTAYKTTVDEQKFQDAYVYADENNTNFDPKSFTYSRKDEKKIAATMRGLRSMIWAGVVLCVASATLVVFGFLMVL